MKRYSLTLDLRNDPELIQQYEEHHKKVWPEIIKSIKNAGIKSMQIYRYGTRLFMIMEVSDDFSFEKKQNADEENGKVQEWETLMWKYQQPLPGSAEGEKWKLMDKIFELIDF
ncbi:MAG TPA: L-rhamnose mutarotase [Chitinophagaceae bacterium]|nr:L-rhamnose mutarotase [Chitinophagaceae bacterium]